MSYIRDLDTPLLKLSPQDAFTVRDACAGVHIFGAIGSGKTSGSGQALAGAYLRAGFGGLVCCAKPEEVELWLRYAKAHGRSNSVLLFDERQGFNFLDYELARQGSDGIGSVTECLMRVLEAARRTTPSPASTGDVFWQDATRQLLRNTIPVLYAADGTVSVTSIVRFVLAAPTSSEQLADPEFKAENLTYQTLLRAATAPKAPLDQHTLEIDRPLLVQRIPGDPREDARQHPDLAFHHPEPLHLRAAAPRLLRQDHDRPRPVLQRRDHHPRHARDDLAGGWHHRAAVIQIHDAARPRIPQRPAAEIP